jgi:DNA polymerase V
MQKNNFSKGKPERGGKRAGSGRPKGSGKYKEPTKAIRVPEGSVTFIKDFLENDYIQGSSDRLKKEQKQELQQEKHQEKNTKPIDSIQNFNNVTFIGGVSVNDTSANENEFPLFSSKVAAGLPSFADDHVDESIDLNNYLVQKPTSTFMLKVQGMSMRDAGILPDDILIVDRSEKPRHNKIVIAALDGELTVKRLYKRGEITKLLPENPDYPEITIAKESQFVIWGVVTGSFRRFESTKFI